jgi:hypothetical protein
MDDLGVWKRALTPLEISGMYLAGVTYQASFAPVVVGKTPVTISSIVDNGNNTVTINYTNGGGASFTLLQSTVVPTSSGNRDNWTVVGSNNTSTPGSFTATKAGNSVFYTIRSN